MDFTGYASSTDCNDITEMLLKAALIFSFICMFCRSLFVLLAIVLSVLRFTDSDQTWGQLLSNVIDYITITLQFS